MSGLASGNGFSVTRTQSFTDVQTNALSADNANVANNERVSNNATDKGTILLGGSDALFNSKAVVPLGGNGEAQNQTLNVTTVTTFQEYSLGTQYKTGKNTYRYCSFAAAASSGGNVMMSNPTGATFNVQLSVTTLTGTTAGATSIGFTTAGGAVVGVNDFAGGYFIVEDAATPGLRGTTYRIIANDGPIAAGTVCTLTLDPNTPLQGTLAGSDEITVVPNPYSNIVIVATTLTAGVVGINIANNAGATITFGWIQTSGHCGVSGTNAAIPAGAMVEILQTGGTAGSVQEFSNAPASVIIGA
ncbi:unnamed protein product, partial [marine sediment metagenome]